MRRVLIVSPRFAPSNAADMHRVRQALPYLRANGWDPTVLAVRPDEVEAPVDPVLLDTLPDDVRIVRVGAIPLRLTRVLGVGQLDLRALPFMARAGRRLLREARDAGNPFHLVFFSTTALDVSVLGPWWLREFGIPYVLDVQDPWVNPYYDRAGVRPPGGRLKYSLATHIARQIEPHVIRRTAHIVSVSQAYLDDFAARYPEFEPSHGTVLPFGAPERDVKVLDTGRVANTVFDPNDGLEHWVYTGRAGDDMAFALEALFTALARARERDPARTARLRLHFVGTDYAEDDRRRKTVAPVADRCGVGDLVDERPRRIPYFEALRALRDADALIIPGSDDPGYTASKLYPYILARRPLLAVFHEASSVVDVVRQTKAGVVVPFRSGEPVEAVARRIGEQWMSRPLPAVETDWDAFEPYTARAMTRRLTSVFDAAAS